MNIKHVAVVTSPNSWFRPYAESFVAKLNTKKYCARLYAKYESIPARYDVVFALSYFRIVSADLLAKHRHTLVVHESALPKGRGWAPLFWQILEGKNIIPITLFDAEEHADRGPVYLRDHIRLNGTELYETIRAIQAERTVKICLDFLRKYNRLKPARQTGRSTQYKRRTPADSELNIDQTIRKQFNLLRIVSNSEFPAFFKYKGKKYSLTINEASE